MGNINKAKFCFVLICNAAVRFDTQKLQQLTAASAFKLASFPRDLRLIMSRGTACHCTPQGSVCHAGAVPTVAYSVTLAEIANKDETNDVTCM